jgi:CheY-like chemotaxis protein
VKILVVDDDPLVRRSLARAFRSKGHTVFEAADGSGGLEIWQKESPDLVVLDVLMPKLSGPQVLRMRPDGGKAKSVLISAYTADEDINLEAGQSNFADEPDTTARPDLFVKKPFANIFETIEKMIGLV